MTQRTIPGLSERFKTSTDSARTRYETVSKFVKLLAAADIPIHKVDNPTVREYLNTEVVNGGAIPKSTHIRKMYLPDVYDHERSEILAKLMGDNLTIQADETSDAQDRPVMNILVASLDRLSEDGKLIYYLLDTVFLEGSVDHANVARTIMESISKAGFPFHTIRVFNSDAAAYMQKCYREILSPVFPNCVHITCLAHLMNLLGEQFRKPFDTVNKFVRLMSSLFFRAGARKARFKRYIIHCKETDINVNACLAPNPVQTRWNSWYDSVAHHLPNLPHYAEFFKQEIILMRTKSPASLTELQNLFRDDSYISWLTAAMRFIVRQSAHVINQNLYFESSTPHMLQAFDTLEEIMINYSIPLDSDSCRQFFDGVHLSNGAKAELTEKFSQAYSLLADKLTRLVSVRKFETGISNKKGLALNTGSFWYIVVVLF